MSENHIALIIFKKNIATKLQKILNDAKRLSVLFDEAEDEAELMDYVRIIIEELESVLQSIEES
ncbi:MAG: hypothetical protein HWN65_22865 [Candidatus Helarchaeota archaeon]|nr:hypothetical protein [Candidatus Helarchaeota archaeon]